MALLLKLGVIWLSIDIIVVATIWYAATAIQPRFPHWWKRFVADDKVNWWDA